MSITDFTAYNPHGVGGFTVADHNGNVRIMLRFLLPSDQTVDLLLDEEMARLTTNKLNELRSNGIVDAQTIVDLL
jgi:hypothetical protein